MRDAFDNPNVCPEHFEHRWTREGPYLIAKRDEESRLCEFHEQQFDSEFLRHLRTKIWFDADSEQALMKLLNKGAQ